MIYENLLCDMQHYKIFYLVSNIYLDSHYKYKQRQAIPSIFNSVNRTRTFE